LRAVRQVAHDIGALFICDEMITGFTVPDPRLPLCTKMPPRTS
jgi:glutamate-1-semialdehyde aminotransferase